MSMEKPTLKIINYCWHIKMSFYLETSGGQSLNLYLNALYFLNTRSN